LLSTAVPLTLKMSSLLRAPALRLRPGRACSKLLHAILPRTPVSGI